MAALREQLCKVLSRDTSKALLQGGLQMVREVGEGGAVYLEVMGVHRKVQFPRGPGEVDSPGRDAALGSACSGSCNPACTNRVVSSQQGALRQLTGL